MIKTRVTLVLPSLLNFVEETESPKPKAYLARVIQCVEGKHQIRKASNLD